MTVWAFRPDAEREPKKVRVQFTYGPIGATCDEYVDHVRAFWSSLGQLIEQIDKEDEEKSE